jgi:putative copper resistance protein D
LTATDGPPGLAEVLTTWIWSPAADSLIVLAVIAYLGVARRYRHRRHTRWPAGRTLCWVIGAALIAACVNSALAVYGRNLLWVHMIVHLVMITAVPALAVWAQPIRLLHDAGGTHMRRVVVRIGKSLVARWLTTPWLTVPLYTVVLVGTHLTGFQQLMPHHMWLHDLELGLYLLIGYLLLLPIVGAELAALTVAPILRFVVLVLCMGPDTLVGVVLMLTRTASAPAYSAGRDWGPSAMADQSIAGAIMWWGGDGLMMILMLVVAARWVGTASERGGSLGPWLDRVRAQTLLGTDMAGDVDNDDAALAAYNARLAALHGIAPHGGPGRHTG